MLVYTICATRTNVIYVCIFTSLILVFSLLAAAYWQLGQENEVLGNRLTVVSLKIAFDSANGHIAESTSNKRNYRGLAPLYFWLPCLGSTY